MSVEHIATVLHHSRSRGTAKLVLLGIANHAGDGGSWPSVRTLALYANVHPRKAQEALTRLEELGEVARHVQAGGTHTSHDHDYERPNLYEVLVECPEGCAGGPNHRARDGYKRLADGTYAPVDNPPPPPLPKTAPPAENGTPPPADTGTQTTHLNHAAQDDLSTTDRATPADAGVRPLDERPCLECSAPDERQCLRRQVRLPSDARHAYQPRQANSRKGAGSAGVSSTSASGAATSSSSSASSRGSDDEDHNSSSNEEPRAPRPGEEPTDGR